MTGSYIVDASALIQAYVREPHTDNVLALMDMLPDDVELHVPEFCLLECTNILWRHVRLHGMSANTAQQAVEDLTGLPLLIHMVATYLPDALTIGLKHELAIYDSLYIALAQGLQLPLITADRKQTNAATALGVTLKPLADFKPGSS